MTTQSVERKSHLCCTESLSSGTARAAWLPHRKNFGDVTTYQLEGRTPEAGMCGLTSPPRPRDRPHWGAATQPVCTVLTRPGSALGQSRPSHGRGNRISGPVHVCGHTHIWTQMQRHVHTCAQMQRCVCTKMQRRAHRLTDTRRPRGMHVHIPADARCAHTPRDIHRFTHIDVHIHTCRCRHAEMCTHRRS